MWHFGIYLPRSECVSLASFLTLKLLLMSVCQIANNWCMTVAIEKIAKLERFSLKRIITWECQKIPKPLLSNLKLILDRSSVQNLLQGQVRKSQAFELSRLLGTQYDFWQACTHAWERDNSVTFNIFLAKVTWDSQGNPGLQEFYLSSPGQSLEISWVVKSFRDLSSDFSPENINIYLTFSPSQKVQ